MTQPSTPSTHSMQSVCSAPHVPHAPSTPRASSMAHAPHASRLTSAPHAMPFDQASPPRRLDRHRTALILGATGGIGGAVMRQLRQSGWSLRALSRQLSVVSEWRDGVHWLRGDAMNLEDVRQAAQGCSVIVHAVNPPGYQGWSEQVLPMLDHTIAAARAERATVLLPGTVYNYGPEALPHPTEDAPQVPATRKGAIRAEMERRLQQAAERGELRALIVRAGDFFGPGAANSWFSQAMVPAGRPVRRITLPGAAGVGHQWAYLPDVAAAMALLLERRDRLAAFARYHFAGHWDADGAQLAQAIGRVVQRHGGPAPRVSRFPWWTVPLAAPFVPLMRELKELRYLWQTPVRLRGSRLAAELADVGGEPHTPMDEAIECTLRAMGCLPAAGEQREVSSFASTTSSA